ncbi:MAG: mechanosensitive ion channel domain-containing protein, partial [Nitrososphaera sp.]
MSTDIGAYLPQLGIIFSSMGASFVFKDYIANLISTLVIKRSKDIKVGKRVKINVPGVPTTKGDIMDIGILRTTVMEVGDGERLPSVRTGRLIKVPNYMLISNPVMIYGDTIIDEVVSYIPRPYPDSQLLVDSMREAIVNNGHGLIEVGLYQKEDRLVIHGVFEVKTSEMADERSKILKDFLVKSRQIQEGPRQAQETPAAEKIAIPLQNV